MVIKNVTMITFIFFILTGCTTTKLLKADFMTDENRSLPDLFLPGNPPGDRIFWNGPPIERREDAKPLEVIVSRDGSRSLRFWQTRSEPVGYLLGFLPSEQNFRKGAFTLQWIINVANAMDRPAYVTIINGNTFDAPILLELEIISRGTVNPDVPNIANVYMGRSASSERPSPSNLIGTITTDRETAFTIVLNIETRSLKLLAGRVNYSKEIPAEITLSSAPSIWFSYGPGLLGAQSIKSVNILHSSKTDD